MRLVFDVDAVLVPDRLISRRRDEYLSDMSEDRFHTTESVSQ